MITPNTKVTALEVLQELGIKDAEAKFGKMRVRIGGIAGINSPGRVIKIQPETTSLEVIVGADLYELELAKGNKSDNAEVSTISEGAREALDAEGRAASEQAEHLTAVKNLARKIRTAEDEGEEYEPNKDEKPFVEEAIDLVDAQRDAEDAVEEAADRPVKKVKSK